MNRHLNSCCPRERTFYLFVVLIALAISGCGKSPVTARTIAITMKKGEISPKEVRVKRNEPVKLAVSTLDVQHGFEIPALKISEPVNPGMPAEIALDTSRPGTYKVQCGVMCGARHDDMRAQIVVE